MFKFFQRSSRYKHSNIKFVFISWRNMMKIISLLFVILSFFSCQNQNLTKQLATETSGAIESIETKQSQKGTVRLLATDAPFDFQSVSSAQITISEVRLRGENGKNIILLDKTVSLELLDLRIRVKDIFSTIIRNQSRNYFRLTT